jgi:outer membrane protein assembly factor BamB
MIVPTLEQGMVFFSSFNSAPRGSGRSFYTAIRALNSSTGTLAWEYRRPTRFVDNHMAGTLSTNGRLVFGSDQSTFFVLSAETGEFLWSVETGGKIIAAPVTFAVDGRQFVTIAAGGDLLTLALPRRTTLENTDLSATR